MYISILIINKNRSLVSQYMHKDHQVFDAYVIVLNIKKAIVTDTKNRP